uniref:Thioredoxin domain-containing protein n=1 Tax=Rhabditophanes sp. KR3021 TaxID=114890 RepID=A0AC35TYM1_9BILA
MNHIASVTLLLLSATFICGQDHVTYIVKDNLDKVLSSSDIVFVAFCADWCPFSRRLKPVWEKAGEQWQLENPGTSVTFAIVDSVQESEVSDQFKVNKFPTMKIFTNGEMQTKEFRGARNIEALHEFVKQHLEVKSNEFSNPAQLHQEIDKSKRNVVVYYQNKESNEFKLIKKVRTLLKDDCVFWIGKDEAVRSITGNTVVFHDPDTNDEQKFTGDLNNYNFLKEWLSDKCIPLVREVTFENVEQLTEEGNPFLLYFRDPKEKDGDKMFAELVQRELPDERANVNALLADGFKFAHPLKHLGKSSKDLPVLAIDSFQHMFMFPKMDELYIPGKLKQFVNDLHTGKLHKDFHETLDQRIADLQKFAEEQAQIEAVDGKAGPPAAIPTPSSTPKASVFKQLKPSDKRYSLLMKSEL